MAKNLFFPPKLICDDCLKPGKITAPNYSVPWALAGEGVAVIERRDADELRILENKHGTRFFIHENCKGVE